jgi:transketolase
MPLHAFSTECLYESCFKAVLNPLNPRRVCYDGFMLTEEQIQHIELKADEIRKDIIRMLLAAGSGHAAGALGMADVFATLYFSGVLNWDPDNPWREDRDRVILSNGHICAAWYATLAHTGAFSHTELASLRKPGSKLQGHPHIGDLPGVENTGGPLGQGISQAVGQALAARMDNSSRRVYCLMSDAEFEEGQTWEAMMFAANNNLHHLTVIIDRNNIQIDGYTETVMPLEPLANKLRAFNWRVAEVDGHNVKQIEAELEKAKKIADKPTVLIAHTIPGKGVEFMEGDYKWHGMPPNREQAEEALRELRTLFGKIAYE